MARVLATIGVGCGLGVALFTGAAWLWLCFAGDTDNMFGF